MSGLVKNRRKYFARISSYNKLSKKQKYTWIPLDTESKTMAKKRQNFVNVNEQLIKDERIKDFRVICSHQESLHSHDAISVIVAPNSEFCQEVSHELWSSLIHIS